MKKTILLITLALIGATASPLAAQQPTKKKGGLASFFRNLGEKATGINMSNELLLSMPPELASRMEILDVKGQGNAASGEVLVTVSVRLTHSDARLSLGGEKSDYATDAKGTRFEVSPRDKRSEGLQELGVQGQRNFEFVLKDVPAGLDHMEVMTVAFNYASREKTFNSGSTKVDPVTMRNIPIVWTATTTTNAVGLTFHASGIFTLKVASCEGNRQTGRVTLTLEAHAAAPKAFLSLGDDGHIEAFNAQGERWKGNGNDKTGRDMNRETPLRYTFVFENVDSRLGSFSMVRLPFYAIDQTHDLRSSDNWHGPVKISNVPIHWK